MDHSQTFFILILLKILTTSYDFLPSHILKNIYKYIYEIVKKEQSSSEDFFISLCKQLGHECTITLNLQPCTHEKIMGIRISLSFANPQLETAVISITSTSTHFNGHHRIRCPCLNKDEIILKTFTK